MKLKLDENLGASVADRLRDAGHDVHTVAEESLLGADDDRVLATANAERRALITNDLDFSDPRHYPPADYAGIVILRVNRQLLQEFHTAVDTLIKQLATASPRGQLWVVRRHVIRVYGCNDG